MQRSNRGLTWTLIWRKDFLPLYLLLFYIPIPILLRRKHWDPTWTPFSLLSLSPPKSPRIYDSLGHGERFFSCPSIVLDLIITDIPYRFVTRLGRCISRGPRVAPSSHYLRYKNSHLALSIRKTQKILSWNRILIFLLWDTCSSCFLTDLSICVWLGGCLPLVTLSTHIRSVPYPSRVVYIRTQLLLDRVYWRNGTET